MFGISSKNLDEYITTEKDVQRRISKMPSAEFLVGGGVGGGGDNKLAQSGNEENEMEFENDDDEIYGDDWIVVESGAKQQDFIKYNTEDKIKRETQTMHSSKSTCILVGRKN